MKFVRISGVVQIWASREEAGFSFPKKGRNRQTYSKFPFRSMSEALSRILALESGAKPVRINPTGERLVLIARTYSKRAFDSHP